MPAQAPAYVPLILPTAYKRYTRLEGSIPFNSGQTSNALRIDPSGTLLTLLCTFTGTISTPASGAAPVNDARAPWTLIKRVTISGGGPGKVVSIPGYALHVLEIIREADLSLPAPVFTGPAGGGGGASSAVSFDFVIPICVRDGDLVGQWSDYLGCIWCGDQTMQLRMTVDWGSTTDVFTTNAGASTISGTLNVTSMKLDTPSPSADASLLTAISWSHQLIAEAENNLIAAAGPLSAVPDLPTAQPRAYLRVFDLVRNGSPLVPANGIYSTLDAELQDTVDFERNVDEQTWLARQARRYGEALPAGTYVLDFSAGNRRDNWLPVGALTLFRFRPTVATGVTLTGTVMDRYSEVVVPSSLAAPWMQAASPQVLSAALGIGPAAGAAA